MRLTTSWLDYPHFVLLGWSGLVIVALLLPLAYLVYDFLCKRLDPAPGTRQVIAIALFVACVVLVYGDELVIAREAQKLCVNEAGLKVYAKAEVDGFIGGSREDLDRGFAYYETRVGLQRWIRVAKVSAVPNAEALAASEPRYRIVRNHDWKTVGGRSVRVPRKGDEVLVEDIESPQSEYEVVTNGQGEGYECRYRQTLEIRNRESGKVMGSNHTFEIWRGWVRSISPVPGVAMRYTCAGPFNPPRVNQTYDDRYGNLVRAVLQPRRRQ